MASPQIQAVDVDGHTTLREASVHLGRLNVLVGANGSGKSNFIHALELLGRIIDEGLQLYVETNGGAARTLRQGKRPADALRLAIDAPPVRYEVELTRTADDRLVFVREGVYRSHPSDRHTWRGQINKGGERETSLRSFLSATKQPGFEMADIVSPRDVEEIVDVLEGCRVFHFHDVSMGAPVKGPQLVSDNIQLRPRAENLASVLLALRESDRRAYRRIVETVRLAAPFFKDFVLQPARSDSISLRWLSQTSDAVFSANQMSDGTLRFTCLATLLLHPVKPHLIVLDEPELGLHPYAIVQLADMLRAASLESQVVLATQSVTLLDQMALEDVFVVELSDGQTDFRRLNPEALRDWIADYSLGELWLKNLIGGRPARGLRRS